jgi:hypothetical protein
MGVGAVGTGVEVGVEVEVGVSGRRGGVLGVDGVDGELPVYLLS